MSEVFVCVEPRSQKKRRTRGWSPAGAIQKDLNHMHVLHLAPGCKGTAFPNDKRQKFCCFVDRPPKHDGLPAAARHVAKVFPKWWAAQSSEARGWPKDSGLAQVMIATVGKSQIHPRMYSYINIEQAPKEPVSRSARFRGFGGAVLSVRRSYYRNQMVSATHKRAELQALGVDGTVSFWQVAKQQRLTVIAPGVAKRSSRPIPVMAVPGVATKPPAKLLSYTRPSLLPSARAAA